VAAARVNRVRSVDPTQQAAGWLSSLGEALARRDLDAAANLFGAECYWRDLAAFTWNLNTCEGRDAIRAMLAATLATTAPAAWALDGPGRAADGQLEAWFTFETAVGRGKGHLRLREGRGWTLLTTLQELKGFEERSGLTREPGVVHGAVSPTA